jgi:hypothetical protein
MHTSDPFTSYVTACVLPAAATTWMVWSLYLLGTGMAPPWLGAQAASSSAKGIMPMRPPVAAR